MVCVLSLLVLQQKAKVSHFNPVTRVQRNEDETVFPEPADGQDWSCLRATPRSFQHRFAYSPPLTVHRHTAVHWFCLTVAEGWRSRLLFTLSIVSFPNPLPKAGEAEKLFHLTFSHHCLLCNSIQSSSNDPFYFVHTDANAKMYGWRILEITSRKRIFW